MPKSSNKQALAASTGANNAPICGASCLSFGLVPGWFQALEDANTIKYQLEALGEMCETVGDYLDKDPDFQNQDSRVIVDKALIEKYGDE